MATSAAGRDEVAPAGATASGEASVAGSVGLVAGGAASVAPWASVSAAAAGAPSATSVIEGAAGGDRSRGEVVYEAERAARIEQLAARAGGVVIAFANTSPRPVKRGYGEVLTVQFSTTWRAHEGPRWREAPVLAVHGETSPAEALEACAHEPRSGVDLRGPAGVVSVRDAPGHQQLWVGRQAKPKRVKLGPGAFHGGCMAPGGRSLWVAWSTPEHPPDLYAIVVRDGAVRPLRTEARPGLAGLRDVRVEAPTLDGGAPAVVLAPAGAATSAVVVLVPDESGPLAGWDALARALADAGVAVVRVSPRHAVEATALARSRWGKPVSVLARGPTPPPSIEGTTPLWLVGPRVDAPLVAAPPGAFVVGEGGATRSALAALAHATTTANEAQGSNLAERDAPRALRWAVSDEGHAARTTAVAWALIIDAALDGPPAP